MAASSLLVICCGVNLRGDLLMRVIKTNIITTKRVIDAKIDCDKICVYCYYAQELEDVW